MCGGCQEREIADERLTRPRGLTAFGRRASQTPTNLRDSQAMTSVAEIQHANAIQIINNLLLPYAFPLFPWRCPFFGAFLREPPLFLLVVILRNTASFLMTSLHTL